MFLVFFIGLLFLFGGNGVNGTCPTSRDNLLLCIKKLLDTDNNEQITTEEINTFLKQNGCLPPRYNHMLTGEQIVTVCDMDADNILTMHDWNHTNACLTTEDKQLYICRLCDMCIKEK